MFYVNMVIKGNGRIINNDFSEDDSIAKILEMNKFKYIPKTVRLNNELVDESQLSEPLVSLKQFWRWQKNVITFAEPTRERRKPNVVGRS